MAVPMIKPFPLLEFTCKQVDALINKWNVDKYAWEAKEFQRNNCSLYAKKNTTDFY